MDEQVANIDAQVQALTQQALQLQEAAQQQQEAVHNLEAPRNADLQRMVCLQGQLLAAQRSCATLVDVKGIGKPATWFLNSELRQFGACALKLSNFLDAVIKGLARISGFWGDCAARADAGQTVVRSTRSTVNEKM